MWIPSAAFMADSQVPWGVDALGARSVRSCAASKPSWYLITTDDRMIPPKPSARCRGGQALTVEEAAASHSVCVSQPAVVAEIAEEGCCCDVRSAACGGTDHVPL
jgi:hypothetical protein